MLRGQMLWLPTEDISLRVIADYSEADEHCCDAVIIRESSLIAAGAFAGGRPPGERRRPERGIIRVQGPPDQRGAVRERLRAVGNLGGVHLGLRVGHADVPGRPIASGKPPRSRSRTSSAWTSSPCRSSPASAQPFSQGKTTIDTMSHELRLHGSTDRFDWMVGFYYSDEEIKGRGGRPWSSAATTTPTPAPRPGSGPSSLRARVPPSLRSPWFRSRPAVVPTVTSSRPTTRLARSRVASTPPAPSPSTT